MAALYIVFLDVVQNKFIPVNNILSTITNRIYKYIFSAGSTYVNDHSSNVVYLITCNKYKLQYVGETSHNSSFRNPTVYSFCKIVNTHFSKVSCEDSSYTVNIIEKLEEKGRTDRNTMDFAAKPNILNMLMLLLNFRLCQEDTAVLMVIKITKVFPVFYHSSF